jgi:hypothetical protein
LAAAFIDEPEWCRSWKLAAGCAPCGRYFAAARSSIKRQLTSIEPLSAALQVEADEVNLVEFLLEACLLKPEDQEKREAIERAGECLLALLPKLKATDLLGSR